MSNYPPTWRPSEPTQAHHTFDCSKTGGMCAVCNRITYAQYGLHRLDWNAQIASTAQHTHDVEVPGDATTVPSVTEVLACPRCNPSAYARRFSTHRRKA